MKKYVEIKNLTVTYDDIIVLKNVNLVIKEHDFLAIIGPNGGGKSTLLKSIVGIVEPILGEIEYHEGIKGKIGYLPQIKEIDRKFPISVFDVVLSGMVSGGDMFRRFNKNDKKKVDNLLEKFNIQHLKKKNIGNLSGGETQKVFLCRALASSPKLLLLDEPNTFVDKNFEKSFYTTLKELNRDMAIVLVTHDLGMIPRYIKSIACVNRYLYYHDSNRITDDVLKTYNYPVDMVSHDIPVRHLEQHEGDKDERDD